MQLTGLIEYGVLSITNKHVLSVVNRIKPVEVLEVYENFYNDRKELYKKYNNDISSIIYVVVNKINGKCYVGSTRSLKTRIKGYFNLALMVAQKRRPIYRGVALYSTLAVIQSHEGIPLNQEFLNPNFITGFIDAEGSFIIIIRKNPKFKIG